MKLTQFCALIAIADCGGFTRAAARMGVSQSAISHAIAKLEEELGCVLLERDRNGVRLTVCGSEVLEHARAVVTHTDRIQDIARATREGRRGAIRFATSQSFALHFLPGLISRFHRLLPNQEIELREGTDPQIAQWLRRQVVDIGVVTLPKEDLTTFPLWKDEMHLLVADGHGLARQGTPVPVHSLAHERLLMPVGGVEPVIRAVLRIGGVEPDVAHRLRDLNSLLAMVAEGLGVTVLPTSSTLSLPAGVTQLPLAPAVCRHVALATRVGVRPPAAVHELVSIAQELAAAGPGAREQAHADGRPRLRPPGPLGGALAGPSAAEPAARPARSRRRPG